MAQLLEREGDVAEAGNKPWLLLIHQVPARPDYLRVKVWRRLQRIGAVAMKNSVWVLPRTDVSLEDFHWLLKEIAADGGEALLCEATFVAGLTAAQQAALSRVRSGLRVAGAAAAAGRPEVPSATSPGGAGPNSDYQGRTWVTRPGVHVDRIASAWLIRRWIDREAVFRFAPEADSAAEGELRFDMYDAEFTHEGDRCTFEVLAGRFVADPVVARIGALVHDIDLKDGKFGAAETPGFARLIEGICARHASDLARIERGAALLDDLYAAFAP